jgi:hypothetical protein
MDALVVWTVMRSFIKGSYEAVFGHKCMLEYRSKGLWNNGDLVLAIHSAIGQASEEQRHAFETLCKFDKVYVESAGPDER